MKGWALALAVALVLVGPAVFSGGLAGSPGGELYGHAWVQAWAAEQWPHWPTGTALAAGAANWPIIDPVPTWTIAGLSRLLGLTAAWNLLVALGVVVLSRGAWAMAEAWDADPYVAALAAPLMPIFLGSLNSGLTEDMSLGLVAFALAAAKRGDWLRAGAWLAATAGCGLYLAWMGGVVVGVMGLVAAGRARALSRWMVAGALVALVGAGAAALPFSRQLASEPQRPPPPPVEPLWALNPWRGADAASFFAAGEVDRGDAAVREHPTWLGVVGLAALGGQAPGLIVGAGVAAAVSLGEDVVWAGRPTGWHNPAATVLHALPMGDRFRNHARLFLVGQLLLVVAAARTARRFRARWPMAGLVLADALFLSPAAAPLLATPAEAPAIYQAAADCPPELPMRVIGERNPQKPLFDQRFHGRTLRNGPNRPDPGRPKPKEEVVVALGAAAAALEAELGPPTAVEGDGKLWCPGLPSAAIP